MRRTILGLVMIAAIAAILLGTAPRIEAASPLVGVLSGPTALAPDGSGTFFLNVSGGPASEAPGNVTIKAYVTGVDLVGAAPVLPAGHTDESNGTAPFRFNVTAPKKDQVITVVVLVNSTAAGRKEATTVTRQVTVITPVLLTATFRNDGGSAAVDVPVKFYVDGKLAGATNITRIGPGDTGTAKFSYLPVGLAPGTHTVRVEADLNRNGVIEADKGEVAVVDLFYKKEFELTWPWAGLIIAITIAISAFVIRARRRRR